MILITHRRKDCIGCNSCVEHAPAQWEIDEKDGKSTLVGAIQKGEYFVIKASDDEYEANKRAAQDCPVRIIHVEKRDAFKQDRDAIDIIDTQIVVLLKKRMSHVSTIMEHKEERALPIEDLAREKQILENITKEAERLGLDSTLAKEIFHQILKSSKKCL